MIKNVVGIILSVIAVLDLIVWVKRKKLGGKAMINGVADILIVIYTVI